jgi:hypothetical protein
MTVTHDALFPGSLANNTTRGPHSDPYPLMGLVLLITPFSSNSTRRGHLSLFLSRRHASIVATRLASCFHLLHACFRNSGTLSTASDRGKMKSTATHPFMRPIQIAFTHLSKRMTSQRTMDAKQSLARAVASLGVPCALQIVNDGQISGEVATSIAEEQWRKLDGIVAEWGAGERRKLSAHHLHLTPGEPPQGPPNIGAKACPKIP